MKIRTIIATCAALAFSMAGAVSAQAQTVTKNFEAAIPNMPGKSLVAVEVDYAPGRGLSVPHPREVGFHLCLSDLRRDRVEGE